MQPLLLLQLGDSAFPAGGFAHSGGLEAAAQLGEVRSAGELRAFLEQILWQTGLAGLPLVRAAPRDPDASTAQDAFCDAFLTSPVANRASRTQGRAFLATSARVFAFPPISALDRAVRMREVRGHH